MNKLIIIGGGAAGLMAAVTAGELNMPGILLERRHRPGLKLLLCGNNRCNISHDASARQMLDDYGSPVADFLKSAVGQFPPDELRRWFGRAGLQTVIKRERIYPATENSDDVLHCFLDQLRELQFPIALNCPVESVNRIDGGFAVCCGNGVVLEAQNVLIATGGLSYPKTGSVGDGLRFATELGHGVVQPRAGLAGIDIGSCPFDCGHESDIEYAEVRLFVKGRNVVSCRGNVLCCGNILRGSAIFDATRAAARLGIDAFDMEIDMVPEMSEGELASKLSGKSVAVLLNRMGLPMELLDSFGRALGKYTTALERASWLKSIPVPVVGVRPLKEAIVTVGGVPLDEINPETMESRIVPGLYFAGEVMDVDGPTGGYNLHAAFSTARLAVLSMGGKVKHDRDGWKKTAVRNDVKNADNRPKSGQRGGVRQEKTQDSMRSPKERYGDPRSQSRGFGKGGRRY